MDYDDAYANAEYIPNAADYPPRWAAAAQAFRDALSAAGRARLNLSYGPTDRQAVDLFFPDGQATGLLVFVHGGYWRRFGRQEWSHFATGALDSGWAVAMPGYDLCPDVSIAQITGQVAHAIAMVADKVPGPIRLAGHSAGGHLVARMANVLPGAVRDRVERVMPISPVADLRPLLLTKMNDDFRMDADAAAAESPVLTPRPQMPVTVWVGGDERPVFLDQARWLADAWGASCVVEAGKHHFDVIDGLRDPKSEMMKTLLG
ncbi:alpha/beta hydrolase [Mesobacterium sp. TK19101]|uniref:Alpha/beta hydrolase n=1 Tax=Mesobacterium hydrothermale TaxID=3111907 RepID=A0ABU6HFU4_9RHOB|nr:alpha/beta hydrolase [Mesobacterium sp. TK19101]MEC3861334.1 alpha/beta hydrolase [Mesobacterium sp. TK19101]